MYTIEQALSEFLEIQHKRLKQKTYGDYAEIIGFFKIYLNNYAYQYLSEEEAKKFEVEFAEYEGYFIKNYGLTHIDLEVCDEFLNYFIVRKVSDSESYVKKSIRVMKKLAKWLFVGKRIDKEQYGELMECFKLAGLS